MAKDLEKETSRVGLKINNDKAKVLSLIGYRKDKKSALAGTISKVSINLSILVLLFLLIETANSMLHQVEVVLSSVLFVFSFGSSILKLSICQHLLSDISSV